MGIVRSARACVLTLAVLLSAASAAADFPTKPLQLMVAFPAGGGTDVAARIVASIAEKHLGQPIVVVNRGGAGGQVGWTDFSRARADGYSLGFINLPGLNTVILDPERKATFKADAFVPVINQVLDPGVVWVRADSPFKTFKDLLEAAKKSPHKISAATTGILSDDHLAILMTEEAFPGALFRIVHLEGGAQQMTGILGGHIDVAFDNVGGIVRRVKSGEVRALVVTDTQRSRFLPDVPTAPELGYKTVISSSTRGIAVPRGTPPAVIKRIEEAFRKAMDDPDHVKKMEEQGLQIKIMVGEEYAKYYRELHAKAAKYTEWARKRQAK